MIPKSVEKVGLDFPAVLNPVDPGAKLLFRVRLAAKPESFNTEGIASFNDCVR
jgi:hypothetical protein